MITIVPNLKIENCECLFSCYNGNTCMLNQTRVESMAPLVLKRPKSALVKECGFKFGWCGFNPDYPHWNHIDKVGNVAFIWFMWIYSSLIV